ncbi:MAG: hypothetical protein U9N51_11800 [Bacteroidota bacterium]|nr:hypothetical protein [Bacteroidota bacterium]
MKKIITYTILMLSVNAGISQNIFNKIIEDSIPQITTGIMDVDTGYVFLSGISNEYGIRSFAFNYINQNGEQQWQRICQHFCK